MLYANERTVNTRTVRFHQYGEPSEVLRLEHADLVAPAPGRVRVRVRACGVNPADWALCRGLFAGALPRGIGLEVAGTVDALGEGVHDVEVGDEVFGPTDFTNVPFAGASDFAMLAKWVKRPQTLDPVIASALPVAIESAWIHLELLNVGAGSTILINGAGTVVGFFAVQIALRRGAKVIAAAGYSFATRLQAMGVSVTAYGEGLADRVLEINAGAPDVILDTAPLSGALPELVKLVGDPRRVMTNTDFAAAQELGARYSFGEKMPPDLQVPLAEYAQLAADGKFQVPIRHVFALSEWKNALRISLGQHAGGKLVLLPGT